MTVDLGGEYQGSLTHGRLHEPGGEVWGEILYAHAASSLGLWLKKVNYKKQSAFGNNRLNWDPVIPES